MRITYEDGQVVAVRNMVDEQTRLATFIGFESATYVRLFLIDDERETVVDVSRVRPIQWPPARA